jgi:hypothetical protein
MLYFSAINATIKGLIRFVLNRPYPDPSEDYEFDAIIPARTYTDEE